MQFRSKPLSNYPVLRSSNPEFASDRLSMVLGATSFDIAGGENEFAVLANHLQIRGLGLSYCEYTGDVSLGFGAASLVRQVFNIDGEGRYTVGNRSGKIAPGSYSSILPAQTPLRLELKSGCRLFVLRIEFDTLARSLSALLGQDIGRKLVFDESVAYGPAMSSLRRRVLLFASEFNARGAFFSDLVVAEIERMMTMNFLMCHRHNYTHLLLRQPLPVSSSAVMAVEEFIEANWDKPIDIQAMSAIAKVSARSLFRQFKRTRGYSPADFAKRIRLNRARELLEHCNEGTSVTQIAFKCGFQNAGHFARDYRLAFGELPSETLRRSASE